MNTRLQIWVSLLLVVALAGCAQQPVRHVSGQSSQDTIDYAKYVKGTVPWFRFGSMSDWDSNDPGHVAIWTTPFEAYWLTLTGPCFGLQGAPAIYVTSHDHVVSSYRDTVIAGTDHCGIMRIDRLDAKALHALRHPKPQPANGKHD